MESQVSVQMIRLINSLTYCVGFQEVSALIMACYILAKMIKEPDRMIT